MGCVTTDIDLHNIMRHSRYISVLVMSGIPLIATCGRGQIVKDDHKENAEIESHGGVDDPRNLETLRDCLNRLGLSLKDATYDDEPPCKLSCLRFETSSGDEIVIYLKYNITLFSAKRKWSEESLLNARVIEVAHEDHEGPN